MTLAKSQDAMEAYNLVTSLQKRFVEHLDKLSFTIGENKKFEQIDWLRDDGTHGGGSRFEARDHLLFNSGSVNVSQVHYEEDETKKLLSATAISTIIHPKNPLVPSIHIHISLTQLKDENSYWRIMADLNPSIENNGDKEFFVRAIKRFSKEYFEEGIEQGDKYFYIPALERHRGVSHFYLENFKTKNSFDDFNFANKFGKGIIDTYIDIITNAFKKRKDFSIHDVIQQLDYHTLYLFQVLTLDKGTTSGLLVHNQNDLGIMGSLPLHVNKKLLKSWSEKVEKPQDKLVENIVKQIDEKGLIDNATKQKLANTVREHYERHPVALKLQASGNTSVATVSNHI